jgi:hypothetical protein
MRYPGVIPEGKIIKTAYSSVDFAPSILNLMNTNYDENQFDGIDFTGDFFLPRLTTNFNKVRFFFDTGRTPVWAAAIARNLKLVVSLVGVPWLFDLEVDPHETINFFDVPGYEAARDRLLFHMKNGLEEHDIPLYRYGKYMFWSTPNCRDSRDRIRLGKNDVTSCMDLALQPDRERRCEKERFQKLCPVTCRQCCTNSLNKEMWIEGELKKCSSLKEFCNKKKVQEFCPVTCGKQSNLCKMTDTDDDDNNGDDNNDDDDNGDDTSTNTSTNVFNRHSQFL